MEIHKTDRIIEKQSRLNKKIVCYTAASWTEAVVEVRLKAPLEAAGFQVIQGNDYEKQLVRNLADIDFVVMQRDFPQYVDFFFHILEEIERYQIPLIYEIDDLLFDLPENHPLQQFGCYSSRLMPMLSAISKSDLVTVSTEPLATFLRPFNANINVLPNYLIDNYWNFTTPKEIKSQEDGLVIGYVGGHTHETDLTIIVNALVAIGRQFGQKVRFKFWGAEPPKALTNHFGVEWRPPVASYQEYALTFHSQEIDIFIAPLADNLFAQSKSQLKYLEYSTLGIPAVYSKVTPYKEVVKHGENGLLASSDQEWIECLQTLISSPNMRYHIAQQAQETARRDWLLSEHADRWSKAYNSIQHREPSESRTLSGDILKTQNGILQKIFTSQITQSENVMAQMANKDKIIRSLQVGLEERDSLLEDRDRIIREREQTLQSVFNSTSWTVTKPLRFAATEYQKVKQRLFQDK